MSYPVELRGAKAPVLMWAQEHEIEQSALTQLRNVSELPGLYGLRVMPDVHWGNGATVGSVIAMEQALAPAAVGVDIGCVDKDTEFLTTFGWVKISEYRDGMPVMQYDPETGIGELVTPSQYVVQDQSKFLHFKTKYGIDQMLSEDHKVLVYKIEGRDRRRVPVVMTARELADIHRARKLGARYEFETSFTRLSLEDDGLPLTDAQIRVQVAVNADGYQPDRHGTGRERAIVAVKKPRKVERMRFLLGEASIEFTESMSAEGVVQFRFHAPRAKGYDQQWWRADAGQLDVIADEVLNWDGDAEAGVFFTSLRESADYIQYVFSAVGYRAVLREDTSRSVRGLPEFRVFRHYNSRVGLAGSPKSPVEEVESVDGKEYCFTLPSGFWVARRNGHIFITGNCGVNAVRTNLTLEDLDARDLKNLRARFESAIPVGFNKHEREVNTKQLGLGSTKNFWARFDNLNADVGSKSGDAYCQLGTLGGGNHFIELCTDSTDRIWITLHSGSRGIGNLIARKHIDIAMSLPQNEDLPKHLRELSLFYKGTPEMDAYRNDLYWAQDYAMLSRTIMMALVKRELSEYFVPSSIGATAHAYKPVRFDDEINCHHNYVAEEIIDGKEMIVTRKGAISAKRGELALIPGSMATGSYIVRGLGNEASFQSASHGAGRKFSRGEAKRRFTVEDVKRTMEGIEARTDEGVIDEISLAYKDLDSVIEAQKDLVEVVEKLDTILCVKG